ncbi:MAG TPA: NUDIX domain-containing protein [Candidatus Saccharimonadales bacterium]|nr:NUDIX domain-containing protein [Candidatus Saccharimonadales bacterium]
MGKGLASDEHNRKRGVEFIGVSCSFVCHDGQGRFLLHKRGKNCRDEHGRWDNGGGAHEFGHSIEDTIKREIQEEFGADAFNLQFIKVYDAHRKLDDGTPTHWVAIVFAAQVDPKQVKNNEPHKIDEIGWFTTDELPSPLHSQTGHTLESVKGVGLIK